MSEKLYTGNVSGMKLASKFLSSEDLIGLGEVTLEISGVYEHQAETMQDGKKQDLFSISFEKTPKKMVLNATNRRVLAFAFGSVVTGWIGQKVTLYVADGIRNPKGGETVTGLRIKASPNPELIKSKRAAMTGGAES